MPLRTSVVFALPFAVAMGLHCVLADRGLKEHYPYRLGAGAAARCRSRCCPVG
jgi:hypothetical protein